MCLETKMLKPLVAEKDITVYKVLRVQACRLYSPYQGMGYKLGATHEADDMTPMLYEGYVSNGLHSFQRVCDAEIEASFHSRHDLHVPGFATYAVFKAIIPAGSLYYAGKFADAVSYASDRLIIVEEVK